MQLVNDLEKCYLEERFYKSDSTWLKTSRSLPELSLLSPYIVGGSSETPCASRTMVDQSSPRRGVQVDLLSGYLLCADLEVSYLAQPMVAVSSSGQTNELSLVE